jgi:L-cysteine desulfidase
MYRVRENPVFDIETGEFISCDAEYLVDEIPIKCDRAIANTAKNSNSQATGTAGQYGTQAQQIGSSVIPGLERDANTPTGYTAQQKSNMLTSGAESTGGADAAANATAKLTATRTGNAGGFADALQNVARQRFAANQANSRDVQMSDADLAQKKQQEARQGLQGYYGVDTGNQLKAMGLANEDLNTELKAKQQGWAQNLEQGIDTAANVAKGAGSMGIGFGAGQTSPGDVPGQL